MGDYLAFWWAKHLVEMIAAAAFLTVTITVVVGLAVRDVIRDKRKRVCRG